MNKIGNIKKELSDINRIMGKAGFLSVIKSATSQITRLAEVTDGKHEDVDFDVVVKCAAKDFVNLNRRLASIPNVTIEQIAENVIGVRSKR